VLVAVQVYCGFNAAIQAAAARAEEKVHFLAPLFPGGGLDRVGGH
jgi:tripartite-type tricarboxylate transporter receptor subunit TctC